MLTEKHLANNGLQSPEAALVTQIDALEAARILREGLQQTFRFLFCTEKYIHNHIGKKGGDTLSAATGAILAGEAFLCADF